MVIDRGGQRECFSLMKEYLGNGGLGLEEKGGYVYSYRRVCMLLYMYISYNIIYACMHNIQLLGGL